MLKQNLQQKLLQKLSPQQIQMIKLLELPTLQLEQRIKKELEENPALEEGNEEDDLQDEQIDNEDEKNDDEFSLEDYIEDDEIPGYKLSANNHSKDDEHPEIPYSESKSFREHLIEQFNMKPVSDSDKIVADYIIGNIDEDGYLRRDLESIIDDIMFARNIDISIEKMEEILELIHDLEPIGVGARNLQESLLIQIRKRDNKTAATSLAERIIENCFEEFTKKHYPKILTKCNADEESLKSALEIIIKLNPKPGSGYSGPGNSGSQTIIPDFILDIHDGEIEISLNARNAPELRLSKSYSEFLGSFADNGNSKRSDKEAALFIKQKLDSAKWFIDAIKQRQNTLLFTINAIVEFQKEFFLEGDETLLKPMILKDIAEITELDISTISRVANSKYVQTPFGNYLLKHFFSEGMQTESGEEVSTREIKQILKDCIENETKSKPLTDDKLSLILKEKGYKIARRTIAKYREQLDIPVARLRKEL